MTSSSPEDDYYLYDYDEDHGIPNVEIIDIIAALKTGGHLLMIVVSKPLGSDRRSQHRLAKKIENYLEYINSEEGIKEFGKPTPEKIIIEVALEPGFHPVTIENVNTLMPWSEGHGAALRIKDDKKIYQA